MKLVRWSWLVTAVIVVISLAVPALRGQGKVLLESALQHLQAKDEITGEEMQLQEQRRLDPYRARAKAFVAGEVVADPQTLLAAGLLADDTNLLKQAVEAGNAPAAWAAYLKKIRAKDLHPWDRIGLSGGDPADTEQIAEEQRRLKESGLPDRISPKEAAPSLDALRAWQQDDPENALPVACEAMCRYGLHQDDKALELWKKAGQLPRVTDYQLAQIRAVYDFLRELGVTPELAITHAMGIVYGQSHYYASLRSGARMAVYQGTLAVLENKPEEAIVWWQGTLNLGQHMVESSETLIGALVGQALMGIGASPAWRWAPDQATSLTEGPLLKGRIFWGEQHDFWVQQVGEERDRVIRDMLVQSKVRTQLARSYTGQMFGRMGFHEVYSTIQGVLLLAIGLMGLIWFLFGTWRRRIADEASHLTMSWQLLSAILMLAPLLLVIALLIKPIFYAEPTDPALQLFAILDAATSEESALRIFIVNYLGPLGAFHLTVLLLPPLAAIKSRAPGARFRTAWRGNLRRILPVAIALCALAYLPLAFLGIRASEQFASDMVNPEKSEMAVLKASLGDRWTNPPIPKDAWRAEYPPNISKK